MLTLVFILYCSTTCLLSVDERLLVLEMESNIAEIAERSESNGLMITMNPRKCAQEYLRPSCHTVY